MYLIYDVIRLQKAALGYGILVKRRDWNQIQDDLRSLTPERIQEAITALSDHRTPTNPTINSLLRRLRSIGSHVPQSFTDKLIKRSEMKGLQVRQGASDIWLTINPSDLSNPLVLQLAGISFSHDSLPASTAAARRTINIISNPVAVAQFFHYVCEAFFSNLLRSGSDEFGILGDVSGHYGVVETNGRGMFHLHSLIWLRGNGTFEELRSRVLNDREFTQRLISFLESIITNTVNAALDDFSPSLFQGIPSFPTDLSDDQFYDQLLLDSRSVANKAQRHSENHNATCFKYGKTRKCRFRMPRDLQPVSCADELGVIHLKRDDGWITSYNPAISTCIRSNHDITWIPTSVKALSYIYYLTNYATKADISPHQVLIKAALITDSMKSVNRGQSDTQDNLWQDPKFLLRLYNALAQDQEISGVQIANSLLQYPNHYTNFANFSYTNLWSLRQCIRSLLQPPTERTDTLGDESCFLHVGNPNPVNSFDNYRFRGQLLADYCFYEYSMLVRKCPAHDATSGDCQYDPSHPKYTSSVQRLARNHAQVWTVSFYGQLSQCQDEEDQVRRGHCTTSAIRNDLAEILLAFFVPWHKIRPLFDFYCSGYATQEGGYSRLWHIVEPTLAPHLRQYARNFSLLQKSKEEVAVDKALQEDETEGLGNVEILDDAEPENIDPDLYSHIESEGLIMACHQIMASWHQDELAAAQRFPMLNTSWSPSYDLQDRHLVTLDVPRLVSSESSGLRLFLDETVKQWESKLKNPTSNDFVESIDDFNVFLDPTSTELNGDGLQPTLDSDENQTRLENARVLLGDDPSAGLVLDIVCQQIPLNRKQFLIAKKLIGEALAWKDNPYDSSKRDQLLMTILGEGGTGKSYIIRAFFTAMTLLQRQHEIMLTAPTGSAADNIEGNTYHTALGLSIGNKPNKTPSQRIQRLWSKKTIMVIDEISMLDLQTLARINHRCNIARSSDPNSSELFGGLPIIIFMGDFYQFPPVKGLPLWRQPRPQDKDEETTGRHIWHRFTSVVILDEQMRQAEDPPFRDLLTRARHAKLTEEDVNFLNSKVISPSDRFRFDTAVSIVRLNSLRHCLNHISMISFARHHKKHIYIFPAQHGRLPPPQQLRLDDVFRQQDKGVNIPSQGLFLYTPGMPCMILANMCSTLGLVNGARGSAVEVVLDPNGRPIPVSTSAITVSPNTIVSIAELFALDDIHILCTKPPRCVLFRPFRPRKHRFDGLDEDLIPVFPITRSITIKNSSIRRTQVPMCAAFSLTDYKVQGQTLTEAVLDLKDDSSIGGQDEHRKFCSRIVQLSRLRTSAGLHLLRHIEMSDVCFQPHPDLLLEMDRLQTLEAQTLAAWENT